VASGRGIGGNRDPLHLIQKKKLFNLKRWEKGEEGGGPKRRGAGAKLAARKIKGRI